MQKLIISMFRFTTAVALYGIEQMQTASSLSRGGQDLFQILDKFEVTLNSMSDALAGRIGDESRKDTLKSVTDLAQEVVSKSFDSVSLMDPREVLRVTGSLWRKSSEVISDWFGKPEPESSSEPAPAIEIMT